MIINIGRIKSNLILMMHIGSYYFIKSDVNVIAINDFWVTETWLFINISSVNLLLSTKLLFSNSSVIINLLPMINHLIRKIILFKNKETKVLMVF